MIPIRFIMNKMMESNNHKVREVAMSPAWIAGENSSDVGE